MWEKGGEKTNVFYVYILKLSNGSFYVGLKPRLVYYEEKHSRYDAAARERELKELKTKNERQIRKMILEFRDKMREVSLE